MDVRFDGIRTHGLRPTARVLSHGVTHRVGTSLRHRLHPLSGSRMTSSHAPDERLSSLLASRDERVVFVHAGLRAVKDVFVRNPYVYLRNVLDTSFDSVLVPGFTPSFRQTGVYHKRYSRPEFGAFARCFLSDADHRTNDAIHSILVRGPYRFPCADHHDTFGPSGCYAQLETDNVLIANVGTPWFVSTQHHFVEHQAEVPYNHPSIHRGTIYYENDASEPVVQRNYEYDLPACRSAGKIERRLCRNGVMDVYDIDGCPVRFVGAADLHDVLCEAIETDPFYLVT